MEITPQQLYDKLKTELINIESENYHSEPSWNGIAGYYSNGNEPTHIQLLNGLDKLLKDPKYNPHQLSLKPIDTLISIIQDYNYEVSELLD